MMKIMINKLIRFLTENPVSNVDISQTIKYLIQKNMLMNLLDYLFIVDLISAMRHSVCVYISFSLNLKRVGILNKNIVK